MPPKPIAISAGCDTTIFLCQKLTFQIKIFTQTRVLLSIPPISKTCAFSCFERSFLCAAPTLWNKLSIDIRMLEFDQF